MYTVTQTIGLSRKAKVGYVCRPSSEHIPHFSQGSMQKLQMGEWGMGENGKEQRFVEVTEQCTHLVKDPLKGSVKKAIRQRSRKEGV